LEALQTRRQLDAIEAQLYKSTAGYSTDSDDASSCAEPLMRRVQRRRLTGVFVMQALYANACIFCVSTASSAGQMLHTSACPTTHDADMTDTAFDGEVGICRV
jgi:hypothetical protein